MSTEIQPIILCGGAGTRLWPESRGDRAKQFLPLTGSESLFRQTVARTPAGAHFTPPVILCGTGHVATVRDQMGDHEAALLVEPMPRNTAAAIALAVARADADSLRTAIAALPAPFREVIVLRELHELNYRDIAEITGAPLGTVMSRLARAREMLLHALRSAS